MKKYYVVGFNDASWIHTAHEPLKSFPYFKWREALRPMNFKEAKRLVEHFKTVIDTPIKIFEIKEV